MNLTPLWIVLAVAAVWAVLMAVLVRFVVKAIRYLRCPPPNHNNSCKAAARYDVVNLSPWKLYFSAVFLLPLRLTGALILVIIMTACILLIKLFYCGRNL